MNNLRKNFWKRFTLDQLNLHEWEALCDGCAKCCLLKIDYQERIFITNISCRKLDLVSCRCSDYSNRVRNVKGCLKLTKENLKNNLKYLPSTCSYKLLSEGNQLPTWHHLICKNKETVLQKNRSAGDFCISETSIEIDNLEEHIIAEIDDEKR